MTGEGLSYDIGSMTFWILLGLGISLPVAYYHFREKKPGKQILK